MYGRLISILEKAGYSPDFIEIADALWLAQYLPGEKPEVQAEPSPPSTNAGRRAEDGATEPPQDLPNPEEPPDNPQSSLPSQTAGGPPRAYPTVDGSIGPEVRRAAAIAVPGTTALPSLLPLARALRPLKQRQPRVDKLVLSEDRTVTASAESRSLQLVFEPMRKSWFDDAVVIIDGAPSMALWEATARQAVSMIEGLGAFRRVRRLRLRRIDDELQLQVHGGKTCGLAYAFSPGVHRLMIVITDGMSQIWRDGTAARALALWGRYAPVAILHVLPPKLWGHTSLGRPDHKVRAPRLGAPNAQLIDARPRRSRQDGRSSDVLVPFVTLNPRALATWADLVMGGDRRCWASGLMIDPPQRRRGRTAGPARDPDLEIADFISRVSPETALLATYLASVSPTPAIARVLQGAMLPGTGAAELAEVFLSGLIRRVTPQDADVHADHVLYDFHDGLADSLRDRLRYSEERQITKIVGEYLQRRYGLPSDRFEVLLEDNEGEERVPEELLHFARYQAGTRARREQVRTEMKTAPRNDATTEENSTASIEGPTETVAAEKVSVPEDKASWSEGSLVDRWPEVQVWQNGQLCGYGFVVVENVIAAPARLLARNGDSDDAIELAGLAVTFTNLPERRFTPSLLYQSQDGPSHMDICLLAIDQWERAVPLWDGAFATTDVGDRVHFARPSHDGRVRQAKSFKVSFMSENGIILDQDEPSTSKLYSGDPLFSDSGQFIGLVATAMTSNGVHSVAVIPAERFQRARDQFLSIDPPEVGEPVGERGYGEDFLSFPCPLPAILDPDRIYSIGRQGRGDFVQDYTRFSVVLDAKERMAIFAAANRPAIDVRAPRNDGFWPDPDLPAKAQLDLEEFRRSPFDRGHLIHHGDVARGDDDIARRAAREVNYATNITPQVDGINRKVTVAIDRFMEATIGDAQSNLLAGPVFQPNDPVWRGISIPQAFWKVFAWEGPAGLSALGFLARQDIRFNEEGDILPFTIPKRVDARALILPIAEIGEMALLDFGPLVESDRFNSYGSRRPNWQDMIDRLEERAVGALTRLYAAKIYLNSDDISENVWRDIDHPELIRISATGRFEFNDGVAEYLRGIRAENPHLGLTILWVDDNPKNNQHIGAILSNGGAHVRNCTNTSAALADLGFLERCDLVVSDMSRDGNDRAGYDLIYALKDREISAPIVIFAGHTVSDVAHRRAVAEAGAFGATDNTTELFDLIQQAGLAAILRVRSSARRELESAFLRNLPKQIRNVSAIPDDEFCTIEEIHASLDGTGYLTRSDEIIDNLLFFRTPRQRSWLVATTRYLLFMLDDAETRRRPPLVQRATPIGEASTVKASLNANGSPVVRISSDGDEPAWFYSESLFSHPGDIEAAIRELVRRAQYVTEQRSEGAQGTADSNAIPENTAHLSAVKAAVSGSSILSFVDNLEPYQKEDVALSLLFAQKAANAEHDSFDDRAGWAATFIDVLTKLGWAQKSDPIVREDTMHANGSLDELVELILPDLAGMSTGRQFEIVSSAIAGLRNLDDENHTKKLFNFATMKTSGGSFQVGTAESEGDSISLALGTFHFEYEGARKKVLFFRWGRNKLSYRLSIHSMSLDTTLYTEIRDVVRRRLEEDTKLVIESIDI